MSAETVLVTGGSGFIGAYCILQLLNEGYHVRATLRSLKREDEVRAQLTAGGAKPGANLTFFAADLTSDAGWSEAASGCDYVLHVASPLPINTPENEDDLIIPAREGALRVLRALQLRKPILLEGSPGVGKTSLVAAMAKAVGACVAASSQPASFLPPACAYRCAFPHHHRSRCLPLTPLPAPALHLLLLPLLLPQAPSWCASTSASRPT